MRNVGFCPTTSGFGFCPTTPDKLNCFAYLCYMHLYMLRETYMVFRVMGVVIFTSGACVSMMYYTTCKNMLWTLYKSLCARLVELL